MAASRLVSSGRNPFLSSLPGCAPTTRSLGFAFTSRSRAARIASFRGRQGEASRGGAGKYLDAGRIAVAPRRCDSANVRLNDTTLSKWNLTIVVSLTQLLSEM
jgi:hypothetical protein